MRRLILIALLVAPGCSQPRSAAIILQIDSELEVPAELDLVVIRAGASADRMLEDEIEVGKGPGRVDLPIRWALESGPGDEELAIHFEILGKKQNRTVVSRRFVLGFDQAGNRTDHVLLAHECVHVACPMDQDCLP